MQEIFLIFNKVEYPDILLSLIQTLQQRETDNTLFSGQTSVKHLKLDAISLSYNVLSVGCQCY